MDRVERLQPFRWHRRPLKVKLLSTLLYHCGLSYRVVAYALRGESRFSHESVRLWSKRLGEAFPKPEARRRRLLALDETKLKLAGQQFYLWACIDVHAKEVLALRVSWARSNLDAELFLRRVLEACLNKPMVLVDRGPWYTQALQDAGLRWRHVTFGQRNRIERWFGVLKHRTKRFYNSFPHHSTMRSVQTYLETYAAWYNLLTKT